MSMPLSQPDLRQADNSMGPSDTFAHNGSHFGNQDLGAILDEHIPEQAPMPRLHMPFGPTFDSAGQLGAFGGVDISNQALPPADDISSQSAAQPLAVVGQSTPQADMAGQLDLFSRTYHSPGDNLNIDGPLSGPLDNDPVGLGRELQIIQDSAGVQDALTEEMGGVIRGEGQPKINEAGENSFSPGQDV